MSSWLDVVVDFGRNSTGAMLFAMHHIRKYMTSIYHIWMRLTFISFFVSAKILHYKVAIFPFIMDKDLVKRYNYPVSH